MIIAMSWIFLRERLSPLQLAGVGVSLAGVLAILSQGQPRDARVVPPQRRRPARDPVDGDVVGLHDLPALAPRGPAHADVPVPLMVIGDLRCCRSSPASSRSAGTWR